MERIKTGKLFSLCNFILIAGALYTFHWYEASVSFIDRISNYLLFFILLVSALYALYAITHYRIPRVMWIILIMVFIFFMYGINSMMSQEEIVIAFTGTVVKKGTYLISVLRSFLPIFVFYVVTRKGELTEKSLSVWVYIYTFVTLLVFYFTRMFFLRNYDTVELTNNVGYLFVMLIPFCFIMPRSVVKYVFLLVNLACVIMSLKRGAILCGFVATMLVILNDMGARNKKRFSVYFIIALFLIVGFVLFRDYYDTSSLLKTRLDMTLQGNSSGRSDLISVFRDYFLHETSLIQIIFGSGADATLKIGQNYAHNDWWELLIDQGLFGLSLYAFLWIELFRLWRKSKSIPSIHGLFGCCIAVLFLKTLFSMSYSMISFPTSMCLGYCFARISMTTLNDMNK